MSIQLPSTDTTTPYTISKSVTIHFIGDGKIAVVQLESNAKAALDAYEDVIQTLLRQWRLGEPLRLIHIMTHRELIFTPLARDRISETLSLLNRTTRIGRSALVIDGNTTRWLAAVVQNAIRGAKNVQQRLFFNYPEAENWVQE
ncbi:MAG: hypothetical protein CUN55_02645 [Phototrophicales bacterium]|nr:MAG: hypothetical protein CUN55_02645 [Phototrophicales bacterium]